MTELQQDDQVEGLPRDGEEAMDLHVLQDNHAWRDHSNREEARADEVLLQRFVGLGQGMRDKLTGGTVQD